MDLYHNSSAPFTNWIIKNGLLQEKFVVIDIGCQGGEHPRWKLLGDQVEFFGFDPIEEVIAGLRRDALPGRTYFEFALGESDEEREFFVSDNTFSSSFFGGGPGALNGSPEIARGRRMVPMRRLDGLFATGVIPTADYIKLDCEGFEPYILRGARDYLAASRLVCVTTETGFNSAFCELKDILAKYRLLVFDVNTVPTPRASYDVALREHPWPEPNPLCDAPHLHVGSPGTLDVVFCPDLVAEAARSPNSATPAVDRLIKAMINFELHGLMDTAFDIAVHFRGALQERFDVDEGMRLLLIPPPHARNTADVINCLKMIAELRLIALKANELAKASEAPKVDEPLTDALAPSLDRYCGRELLKEALRRLRRRILKGQSR
jgi:FkbM family methyltransferase